MNVFCLTSGLGASPSPAFLTEAEAGRYLNISLSTLRRLRAAACGPAYSRFGKIIRYRKSDLDAFMQANSRRPEVA